MLCANLRVLASTVIVGLSLAPVSAMAQHTGGGGGHGATPSVSRSADVSPEPTFMTGSTTTRAENESKIEFKSEVVLVQFPVVVTDKTGNHVHNLKKEGFQA